MAENRIGPDVCRRCFGQGATRYRNTDILCPSCAGCGLRRPYDGASVELDGVTVGYITDAGDEWQVVPYDGVHVPPTMAEVIMADREDEQRGGMED